MNRVSSFCCSCPLGGEKKLHITSIVTDWETNTYTRRSIYRGYKEKWRECIEKHINRHLKDLNTDAGIVKGMMRNFEVDNEKLRIGRCIFSNYH